MPIYFGLANNNGGCGFHFAMTLSFYVMHYQVNYSNHREFSEGSGNHKLSPIRMFTNTDVSKIALPGKDGYK